MISVLYVDDEPAFLDLCKIFLERNDGFSVETSLSAQGALDALARTPFNAVVSDYQMPGMNGIDLLKEVRLRYGRLPFILLTGRGREDVAIEALNNGASFYLQKGGNPKAQFAELVHMIRQAVGQRRIEEELRKSEERYRNVVEDQTEFICRFRPDGKHLFVNDAYSRYFGMPKDALIGTVFRPVLPPSDADRVAAHLRSLTKENPAGTIENRIILPDGEIRYHRWNDRAIFNEKGEVVEYQSAGRDITDRIHAEDLLRQSEQYLTDLFNFLPDATFAIDLRGRVIAWNRAVEEMTGVRAADIVGKDDYEYAIPFYGTRRPILVDLVLNPDLPVDRSYLNYQVTNRGINTLVAEANGLVVRGKEMAVWAKATLLYDRHGNVVGGIEAVRDITRRKKIEENLRESENRYRTIFESTNAPSTILEEDTTIALANSAYEQLSGYSREELEGRMSWTAFVHKDDLEMTIQYHKSRLNSPDPVLRNHAFRFIARSGELKDIFATVAMIPGTRQTVASFHDITELKNTERALVAERGKLAVTLRSIGDAVIVTDGEGGVELMNQVAELLTGWTENEAKGRTLEEVFVIVNEKTRKRCANPVETVISNGVTVGLANHTVLIARDGTERAIADSGAPIRNESGTITGIVLVFRDVTAERKAQTALLESKKQLSLVLEGTRDAFFDWNISAGTVAASPRIYEMFGYAAGEIPLTFDAWKARTHPDDVKRVIAALEEHLEGRTPRFREEYRMRARSGKYVWILGRGTVVRRDASGKPLRMAGTFTDITERKLTEESLLRSNRRLSLINSITRNDLLNDLTIVLGYLTFIEEAKTLDEVQQYRAKIEESTRKMQSHLDFTQDYQEIGRKTPQYIPVEGALSKALIGLDLTRMKLSIELDEFEILADHLLEKVFFNLIENATRHGGNEISTIRVTYRETERGLTLIMEDNGTGVPHAEKELIFQKGFGKNTGLGLFLVREVLAITGIDIRETGEPGKGARFEITIPPGGYRRKGAGL